MNKKSPWLLAFIAIAFIGCTTTTPHTLHTQEIKTLMQSANTAADHEALASHYEADARIFEEKAEEHKKLLSKYERRPWLFGKRATGFGNHCKNLIRIYGQAKQENLEMAKMHRELAKQ